MDMLLLSGTALICMALGAMSCLIHAEVRDRRRVPYRRPQPSASPRYGRLRSRTASRPRPAAFHHARPAPSPSASPVSPWADPWAPFAVRADTSIAEIKGQYRVLARRYHPDCGGDPRTMARINGLYAELLRRKQHAGG